MLPTASSLDRALACPASCALPQVKTTSEHADNGTAVHAFIVRAREVGRDAALAEVPEESRDFCAQLPLDELPAGGRHELAYAWNYVTGEARILGCGTSRDYSDVTPEEYCGTADLIGAKDGRGVVDDWKSGRYVGEPGTAAQLLLAALALVSIDPSMEEVEVAFFYLRDDGTFFPDRAIVDRFDLAAFAERLKELPRRIEHARQVIESGRQPDVNNGPWCRYCPAAAACPAKTALARSFGAELATIREKVGALSPVEAGKVYAKALEYKDLVDEVIAGLKDVARVHPLELPDGRVLREVEWKLPTKVTAEIAEEVLTDLHGEQVAKLAIETEKRTTLTAITKALRTVARPGTLAKLERQAVEQIRNRGGLKEGTAPQVRAVKGE